MNEQDEGDIKDVVGEKEDDEEVERKSEDVDMPIGSFYIKELLQASLIDYHLSYILVLILDCYVQWGSVAIVFDVAIATPDE